MLTFIQTKAKLKNQLLRNLFLFVIVVGCFFNCENSLGQTVSFTSANSTPTNGITASPLTAGQTNAVIFGVTITVTGTFTINQFVFSSTQNGFFTNAKLYRSTAGSVTFAGSSLVTTIGAFGGSYISVTGLSETITNTNYTYFIVADLTAIPGYVPLPASVQISLSQAIQSSPYSSQSSTVSGINYNCINPTYTLTDANTAGNGITQGTLIESQTGIVLFGFGVSASATTTVTGFNINSSSTGNYLSYYLGNGKLYRSTSSTFSLGTATLVSGATVAFSNYQNTPGVAISGLTETITTATEYYFLVADFNQTGGTLPANIQFQFNTSQTNAIVQSSPSTANIAPTSNITGTTFTLSNPIVTITSANASGNGITQGTLYPGQTGIVLYGFGVTVQGTSTLSGFNLYDTYNQGASTAYLNNGKIYRSSSSTFSLGTATLITGATVSFGSSAATGVAISGLSESFSNNVSPVYYFIVGDFYTGYYGTLPATTQFGFLTSQTNPIVQSSPSSANITVSSNYNGTSFSLSAATLSVTGYNSTSNGITSGSLNYGETNIVLFGFSVTVGGIYTINEIDLPSNISSAPYFTNGKLYRSTTPYFSDASQVTGTVAFGAPTTIKSMSEALNSISGTATYYYFVVGDFTATTSYTAPTTFQYNFSSGTISFIQTSPYTTYSTPSTTNGTTFSILNSYDWIGGTSSSFTLAANFNAFNGGAGNVPGTNDVVRIGGKAFTHAPVIAANTTIGGLTFSNVQTPSITINSGTTLTLNNSLSVVASTAATITGTGAVTLGSSSVSATAASSTLNLSGDATLNNAGIFTMASTSGMTFAGSSTLANTGTFTLVSDATSSAYIGSLASGTVSGTFNIQRFLTGGAGMRGYRLLSSPVYGGTANSNKVYSINYIANSCYITGTTVTTGGIDKAGNPTLYLFRENLTPSQASFTSGNFRGVGNMGTTGTANIAYTIDVDGGPYNIPVGNGYLFFFRGDRSVAPIATETVTSYVPTNTTLTAIGTLNTGNITYKNWYTPTISTLLDASVTGNSSILGYNLAGNPYPSAISWTSVFGNASTTNISPIIYEFNAATNQYGFFNESNSTSTQNAGNVIGSGQGFFVIANNTSATLAFTEANKVTTQPSTLLLGLPVGVTQAAQYIHLKMIKDSMNFDDIILGFNSQASTKYVPGEDAVHLNGNSPPETLTSLSSDSIGLAGNFMPYPGATTSQVIRLNATATASGTFKFLRSELVNIPALYEIWLMDSMQKDSLDLRANTTYAFDIDNTNPASYGAGRFQVVVRQNPALGLHLLAFNAVKVTTATQVQVSWTVENEANYTTFYVQRSTDNGKTFQSIGSLQSDGSGTYSFIDKSPVTTVQDQYRLQMSDANNTITYSSVITIQYSDLSNNNLGSNISLYPNPAHDLINISLTGTNSSASSYAITITNSIGTVVKTATSSQSTWQNNVSDLLPGTYFVQIVDNNSKAIVGKSKFIKL